MTPRLAALAAPLLLIVYAAALPRPAFAQLGSLPPDEWIQALDAPERVAGLKIPEVLGALKVHPGMVIADIGAGTGQFTTHMALGVKPGGTVYAVDIDRELLAYLEERAIEQGMTNVKPVLGDATDPLLPVDVDIAFLNDTLHHIEDRAGYLATLALYLKPGGRIAIIDFRPDQGPHKGNPAMIVSEEQATAWLAPAGLKPLEQIPLFSDRWFVVYGK